MAHALKYLIQLSAVGTTYFLLVRYAIELTSTYPGAHAIWPQAGFALAAVILAGYRVVPAIFAAAYFAAAYIANAGPFDVSHAAAATAAGCAVEALLGGFLVNWWAAGRNAFATPTDIAKFAVIAVLAAAIGASVDASVDFGLGVSGRIEQVDWEKLADMWSRAGWAIWPRCL